MHIVSLAERTDLVDAMWAMPNLWPEFMLNDPIAGIYFSRLPDVFPEFQLVGLDDHGTVIAKINSVPFVWSENDDDLPDSGWDGIQQRGFDDRAAGREPTAVSLLEARIVPTEQGGGLSAELLAGARKMVLGQGLGHLLGPVRPAAKAAEPRTPMVQYAARVRPDGLPADPWIRTHHRLGARIVKVCPTSMTIPGTLRQWRSWTGLPFDESGSVDVAGALVPVSVDVDQDHAVYVEPNVWMHHRLG